MAVYYDGYTMDGEFKGQYDFPPFKFRYRPAVLERVLEHYRRNGAATTPAAQAKNITDLLVEHVVDMDVQFKRPDREPEQADAKLPSTYLKLPEPVLLCLVNYVTGYQGWGEDAKKSPAESGRNSTSPDSAAATTAHAGSTTPRAAS